MSYPNMSTLMKRLEAATSRLEDLANFYETDKAPQPVDNAAPSAALSPNTTPKGSVDVGKAPVPVVAAGAVGSNSAVGSQKHEYKVLDALDTKLQHLLKLSKEIDEQLYLQCVEFKNGNEIANNIAKLAGAVTKPTIGPEFTELFLPINQQVEKISSFRETNRTSKFVNHFQVVSEAALVFGWVTCPAPSDYVQDLKEAAQFYANKVLKDYREVAPHAEWVKTFLGYCNDLTKALADELSDGLDWNPKGIPLNDALKDGLFNDAATGSAASSGVPASASAPAPPPGPPPSSKELMADKDAPDSSAGGPGAMNALFAEISQGTEIHSNLKHIDRKALKAKPKPPKPSSGSSGSGKPAPAPGPASSAKSAAQPAAQPASTTLNDNKWLVENYSDNHEISLEVEMKHTVYIENCHRCTIVVKNKGTSVVLNNCSKVGIMVDTLVSGLDFLGCTDCQAQTNGRLPSLMLDKSNNMQIYLNEESLDVDIRTVNTWSINLEIPTGEPGDYEEVPIAEQISHSIDPTTKKVKSVAVAPGM